jgi:hypothetical protein
MNPKIAILIGFFSISILLIVILVPLSFSYIDYYDVRIQTELKFLVLYIYSVLVLISMHLNEERQLEMLIQK